MDVRLSGITAWTSAVGETTDDQVAGGVAAVETTEGAGAGDPPWTRRLP